MPIATPLNGCRLCGHGCGIDRAERLGFCRIDDGLYVANVCLHTGEEPVLGQGGKVCNVFFAHCNLQCSYCQNYQISCNTTSLQPWRTTIDRLVASVAQLLDEGCDTVGFVSPTPYLLYIPPIIQALHARGHFPTVVYNTNGYEHPSALLALNGLVDIYLPDYKYGSYELASSLSGARDYPDVALSAIAEMVRQCGVSLQFDAEGVARRGIIVRHLVLPGYAENSRAALINLAVEFGTSITLSLLSQYNPAHLSVEDSVLGRRLAPDEYAEAVLLLEELGFQNGWIQELESADFYNPDFRRQHPFQASSSRLP